MKIAAAAAAMARQSPALPFKSFQYTRRKYADHFSTIFISSQRVEWIGSGGHFIARNRIGLCLRLSPTGLRNGFDLIVYVFAHVRDGVH